MHDQTLINLLQAKRLAERLAEPHQNENSNKLVIVPVHAWEKLMEATQAVLLEEIQV
jgi:hypothetical protein